MTILLSLLARFWWLVPIAALATSTWWYRGLYVATDEEFTAAKAVAQAAWKAQEKIDAIITGQREADIAEASRIAAKATSERDSALVRARARRDRLLNDLIARDANIGAARAAAPEGGISAPEATGVPTDVFGRCVDRTIELASYADAARIAGEACVRAYESLTKVQPEEPQP